MTTESRINLGNPVTSHTLWARGAKRVFDAVAGTLLVILWSPLLLAAALAIKLTSRGPLFFHHTRVGRNGAQFVPFKFRTMAHGRASDAVELVPLDHPEITPVGRFLRRTKIDELPQLLNVLRGEMSLVGPRPDLPEHLTEYTPFRLQRLAARPGLTGLGQVNGSASISWDQRSRYDVYYIARCSLWLDLCILVKTIGVIFRGEAYYARRFEDSPYYDPAEPLGWDPPGESQTGSA
jgi:lipopolysaccharide/colanic/teichoic acid biosynthesis glycosyltransferase